MLAIIIFIIEGLILLCLFFIIYKSIQKQDYSKDKLNISEAENDSTDYTIMQQGEPAIPIIPIQPHDLQQIATDNTKPSQDEPKKWWNIWDKPIEMFTGVLAICTIFLVINSAWQIHIVQDTAIRQLRAYVHVDKITITNIADPLQSDKGENYKPTGAEITDPKNGPSIDLEMVNTGQTPAYKLKGWAVPMVFEYPIKPHDVIIHPPAQTIAIIGRDAIRHLNNSIEKPLTKDEISALRNHSKAIYIFGEITYTDIFMELHHTNFIYYQNSTVGTIGISKAAGVQQENAD